MPRKAKPSRKADKPERRLTRAIRKSGKSIGLTNVSPADFKESDMTHPNSPKGALLRHGYTLHKDPRYPHSQRRTVKDSAGVVVLDDAPLDAVCDFCKRNGLYLPE